MKAMFLDLIGLRSEVWNRLSSNQLFSRDKKYNRLAGNMVLISFTRGIYITSSDITNSKHPRLPSKLSAE